MYIWTSLGTEREKAAMLSLSCSMLVAPIITDPEKKQGTKYLSFALPLVHPRLAHSSLEPEIAQYPKST